MSIYENTEFKPNEIGIFTDLPMETYRDAIGLAESDLQTVVRSPAAYLAGERKEPTEDMGFGTLFHSFLLSGAADYYVTPATYPAPESARKDAPMVEKDWNWNATFCRNWREAHSDKPIIPIGGQNSCEWLHAMTEKTNAHPLAKSLLSRLSSEVSVFARHADYPILCKGRFDGLIRGDKTIVVEVKTTRDASTKAFSREILNRGYHKKAAWYRMLLHQLRISPMEFWFIAVEKSNRPRVNIRKLAERAMDKGDLDNDDALKLYMKCRHGNYWPELSDAAFPGESSDTPTIDLPDYAYGKDGDLIEGLTEPEET